MPSFHNVYFHVDEKPDTPSVDPVPMNLESLVQSPASRSVIDSSTSNWSDEQAARYYLESFLRQRSEEGLSSLIAPLRSETMPDMQLNRTMDSPLTETRILQFRQTNRSIPIFGAEAVVEIRDRDRHLVSLDAKLAEAPDVSPIAQISPKDALAYIAKYCEKSEDALADYEAMALNYYLDQNEKWHLVYYFAGVAGAPVARQSDKPEADHSDLKGCHGHGDATSPRHDHARYDYLVDANDGEIVFLFSSYAQIDVPIPCDGEDEDGVTREFDGRHTGHDYEMVDPLRNIKTYDHSFNDITISPPTNAIDHPDVNFQAINTAGVSAHYHAQLVFDFYNNTLKRKGIDDKGMGVISYVNCTYNGSGKHWKNAVWYKKKMWYGQQSQSGGGYRSLATYLDVIAHELTHGVTETTSNLVYRDESGALNESFSDTFGVIINNWYPNEPNAITGWDWEIGSGLGAGGLPLRDMSDPKRTGDPDKYSNRKYIGTNTDNGGVHINSNIHNKAAYNLLTSTDSAGAYHFPPKVAALLYYLTLVRLTRIATFSDCLRVLKSVARTYYSGNTVEQTEKIKAIEDAYDAVEIR